MGISAKIVRFALHISKQYMRFERLTSTDNPLFDRGMEFGLLVICGDRRGYGTGVVCYLTSRHPEAVKDLFLTDVGFAGSLVAT